MNSTSQRSTARLKALLAARSAAILPGTPNALFARAVDARRDSDLQIIARTDATMDDGADVDRPA